MLKEAALARPEANGKPRAAARLKYLALLHHGRNVKAVKVVKIHPQLAYVGQEKAVCVHVNDAEGDAGWGSRRQGCGSGGGATRRQIATKGVSLTVRRTQAARRPKTGAATRRA